MTQPLEINDPIEASMKALENFCKLSMPTLNQVIHEFPNPNEQLIYPALSITPDPKGGFTNIVPYEESVDDTITNNSASVLWIVGQWDIKIQLDFWGRNKLERNRLFSAFFAAFNSQIEPMGLSLKLGEYYNLWARYDMNGYQHKDDEASSQRQEWRTMVELLVHVKHALTKQQFMMTQPIDLDLEIREN